MALAGIDAGVVSRTAVGCELGDGADGRGPFVSGRERERREASEARPSWAKACWAGSRGRKGGRRRRARLLLRVERRVRRRMSP